MGEDNLSRHATKDECHGDAEEDQVVIRHESRVRAVQPPANAEYKNGHGRPLEEDGKDRLAARLPSLDDVVDAERNVRKERRNQDGNPEVNDRHLAQDLARQPQYLEALS